MERNELKEEVSKQKALLEEAEDLESQLEEMKRESELANTLKKQA